MNPSMTSVVDSVLDSRRISVDSMQDSRGRVLERDNEKKSAMREVNVFRSEDVPSNHQHERSESISLTPKVPSGRLYVSTKTSSKTAVPIPYVVKKCAKDSDDLVIESKTSVERSKSCRDELISDWNSPPRDVCKIGKRKLNSKSPATDKKRKLNTEPKSPVVMNNKPSVKSRQSKSTIVKKRKLKAVPKRRKICVIESSSESEAEIELGTSSLKVLEDTGGSIKMHLQGINMKQLLNETDDEESDQECVNLDRDSDQETDSSLHNNDVVIDNIISDDSSSRDDIVVDVSPNAEDCPIDVESNRDCNYSGLDEEQVQYEVDHEFDQPSQSNDSVDEVIVPEKRNVFRRTVMSETFPRLSGKSNTQSNSPIVINEYLNEDAVGNKSMRDQNISPNQISPIPENGGLQNISMNKVDSYIEIDNPLNYGTVVPHYTQASPHSQVIPFPSDGQVQNAFYQNQSRVLYRPPQYQGYPVEVEPHQFQSSEQAPVDMVAGNPASLANGNNWPYHTGGYKICSSSQSPSVLSHSIGGSPSTREFQAPATIESTRHSQNRSRTHSNSSISANQSPSHFQTKHSYSVSPNPTLLYNSPGPSSGNYSKFNPNTSRLGFETKPSPSFPTNFGHSQFPINHSPSPGNTSRIDLPTKPSHVFAANHNHSPLNINSNSSFASNPSPFPTSYSPFPVNRGSFSASSSPVPVNLSSYSVNPSPSLVNQRSILSNSNPSPVNLTSFSVNPSPCPSNRSLSSNPSPSPVNGAFDELIFLPSDIQVDVSSGKRFLRIPRKKKFVDIPINPEAIPSHIKRIVVRRKHTRDGNKMRCDYQVFVQ